jgi:hypothetical protein
MLTRKRSAREILLSMVTEAEAGLERLAAMRGQA